MVWHFAKKVCTRLRAEHSLGTQLLLGSDKNKDWEYLFIEMNITVLICLSATSIHGSLLVVQTKRSLRNVMFKCLGELIQMHYVAPTEQCTHLNYDLADVITLLITAD